MIFSVVHRFQVYLDLKENVLVRVYEFGNYNLNTHLDIGMLAHQHIEWDMMVLYHLVVGTGISAPQFGTHLDKV